MGCSTRFLIHFLTLAVAAGTAHVATGATQIHDFQQAIAGLTRGNNECACSDTNLCKHLTIQHPKEVFGFIWPVTKNFRRYNWTHLTTVAWLEDPELVCVAHAQRCRVVMNAGDVTATLTSPSKRIEWVQKTVQHILDHSLDGVNFDLEMAMQPGSDVSQAYTQLVSLTARVLREVAPGTQVSVDVPWSPFDVDGRNYDWLGLSNAADLLFVMAYDMQSQIWGRCIASANTPMALMIRGLNQWINLGVPKNKIVLGLPWYGYDYPCQNDVQGHAPAATADVCVLQPVPFSGAPCSDAAGMQRTYADIKQLIHQGYNTTPVLWDELQEAAYFNYKPDNSHQVWFDNPMSLKLRYKVAADMRLRGVGFWNLEWLYAVSSEADPSLVEKNAREMWAALDAFTGKRQPLSVS